jgi:hypothetical protein
VNGGGGSLATNAQRYDIVIINTSNNSKKMTPEELKRQITVLRAQVSSWSKMAVELEQKANNASAQVDVIISAISHLQDTCRHTFEGKKPGFMGRGICEICGKSDY